MATQLRRIEILLVEDCEPDARLFSELLKDSSSGYRLSVVSDGEQAVDFLQRRNGYLHAPHPHLIVLDLNLPKRTGLEILQEIRSSPALQPTPVVILTSSHREKDVDAAYRWGANLYLKKPSTLEQFEALMQALSRLWLEFGELPRVNHDS